MGLVLGDLAIRHVFGDIREVAHEGQELAAVSAAFQVCLDLLPFAGRGLTLYKSAENAFMRMHRTH